MDGEDNLREKETVLDLGGGEGGAEFAALERELAVKNAIIGELQSKVGILESLAAIQGCTDEQGVGVDAAWAQASEQCLANIADIAPPGTDGIVPRISALEKKAKAFAKDLAAARKGLDSDHVSAALPEVLVGYRLLKKSDGVTEVTGLRGARVRPVLALILEDPESDRAVVELEALGTKLKTAYQAEIEKRLAEENLFKESAEVIAAGNDAFVDIYGAVSNLIEVSEPGGVSLYKAAAQRGKAAVEKNRAGVGLAAGAPPRNPPTLPALYQASARAKPAFDGYLRQAVDDHNAEYAGDVGMQVELLLPRVLKDAIRTIEKAMLVANPDEVGNCGMVLDVIRAMVVCDNMRALAAMFDRLVEHTGLKIIRLKERFFEIPSAGGWRDMMANFSLVHTDTGVAIYVEVQLCHSKLLTARADLPGHLVYNPVRNAMELIERKFGSTSVAADAVSLATCYLANLPDGGNKVDEAGGVSTEYSTDSDAAAKPGWFRTPNYKSAEYAERIASGRMHRMDAAMRPHTSAKDLLLEDKGWLSGIPLCEWERVDTDPESGRVVRLDLKGVGLQGRLSTGLVAMSALEFLDLRDNPDLLKITAAPVDSLGMMCFHTKGQTQAFLRHLSLADRGREIVAQRQRLVEKHGPDGPTLLAIFERSSGKKWAISSKRWFSNSAKLAETWHGVTLNKNRQVVGLSFVDTGISVLPECIVDLAALVKLNLQGCKALFLTSQPVLRQLKARGVHIDGVNIVDDFTTCTELDLSHMPGGTIPPEVITHLGKLHFPALQTLLLGKQIERDSPPEKLTELPEAFFNLEALQTLRSIDFHNCCNLKMLPESIVNLQYLDNLNMPYCRALEGYEEIFTKLNVRPKMSIRFNQEWYRR